MFRKNYFFTLIFLSALSFNFSVHSENKKVRNSKVRGNIDITLPPFKVDRLFIEDMLTKHPMLVMATLLSSLGLWVYPDEISDAMKKIKTYISPYKNHIFAGSCAAAVVAYIFRDQLLQSVFGVDDEDEDEASGNDGIYSFSNSSVRIYQPGDISTKFVDVAGLHNAKEDIQDILMYLKNPRVFKKMGAKVPRGILLHGPSGTGKTLLARALAGEAQCAFLYVSATEFEQMLVGVGAARIRHLFVQAHKITQETGKPCIVFIDEIDAVGHKRGVRLGNSSDQTLNEMLVQMDGFEQNDVPVIVIGATNRIDILDEALLRPGRFDRKVHIALPYFKDRVDILNIYLKKIKVDDTLDVAKIACATDGFSGAQLAALVNEAAILAIRDRAKQVTMQHMDEAYDYLILGRATQGMEISKEEFYKTAVHESGHALARVYQDKAHPLYKVTIQPRGGALGITYGIDKETYSRSEQQLRAEIIVALGGSVAEEMIFGIRGAGAISDLQKARQIATAMVMKYGMTQEFKDVSFYEFVEYQFHLPDQIATKIHEAVADIIHECRSQVEKILLDHKDELLKLAEMLLEQQTVSGAAVYDLCHVEQPDIVFSLV